LPDAPKDAFPDSFPERSVGIVARIEEESGQWVVFLDVTFWREEAIDAPLETVHRRIASYSTLDRARVAANFMLRAAARDLPHPPLGS